MGKNNIKTKIGRPEFKKTLFLFRMEFYFTMDRFKNHLFWRLRDG